jgi:hypothetical protein
MRDDAQATHKGRQWMGLLEYKVERIQEEQSERHGMCGQVLLDI